MAEENNYKNFKGFGRKCFWPLLLESNKRRKGISGQSINKWTWTGGIQTGQTLELTSLLKPGVNWDRL